MSMSQCIKLVHFVYAWYKTILFMLKIIVYNYQSLVVCAADTQSSCIKQSLGLGAGNLSKYSISNVSSVEASFSWRCSESGEHNSSPHTKKSNSTTLLMDGFASFKSAFTKVFSSAVCTLLCIANGLSGTAYLKSGKCLVRIDWGESR